MRCWRRRSRVTVNVAVVVTRVAAPAVAARLSAVAASATSRRSLRKTMTLLSLVTPIDRRAGRHGEPCVLGRVSHSCGGLPRPTARGCLRCGCQQSDSVDADHSHALRALGRSRSNHARERGNEDELGESLCAPSEGCALLPARPERELREILRMPKDHAELAL